MSVPLIKNPPLTEDILFLDGVTRAGKFMLGKVVSNFKGVDYFQYVAVLEHLPLLEYHGTLDRTSAIALMQLYANQATYERAIGRGLNCRPDDSSSILNATDSQDYLDRMKGPAYEEAVEIFKKQKRLPAYLIHECLPMFSFFEESFPKMKMINIQRHPIDLAHSWYKRGWGKRGGTDPLAFNPMFNQDGRPVWWFAYNWKKKYSELSEADRVVKSIVTLSELDAEAIRTHGHKTSSLCVICYEHMFASPQEVLKQMSSFLGKVPFENMDDILKREGIPAKSDLYQERIAKLNDLKKVTSPDLFEELKTCSKTYESHWGLEMT